MSPEYIVNRGDKVSINQNKTIDTRGGTGRDVLSGEIFKCAYLMITTANGEVHEIDTPFRFFPRYSIDDLKHPEAILQIITRVVNNYHDSFEIRRLADLADLLSSSIRASISTLDDNPSCIDSVVGLSITLGQLLAKVDAATRIEPMAELGERTYQKSRDGGLRSGTVRRNAAWRATALQMITKVRGRNPSYSQDSVASEVIALWTEEKHPSHKTLKKYISDLESQNLIPRRQRTP